MAWKQVYGQLQNESQELKNENDYYKKQLGISGNANEPSSNGVNKKRGRQQAVLPRSSKDHLDTQGGEQTMDQLRSEQKAFIMSLIKKNKDLLVDFSDIMNTVTSNRQYPTFDQLQSTSDFCDGFMVQQR